jgi:thiol-disulfide isomerase/thioredoxin
MKIRFPGEIITFLCLLLWAVGVPAQNVTIKGIANPHKGKEIGVYLYDDLITYAQTRMDADTIDDKGNFELQLSVSIPQLALIKVGQLSGRIYLQPNFTYGIIIPPTDTTRFLASGTEQNMDIIINGDSTELNARIIDFNNRFDEFWQKHYTSFVSKRLHHELDSFQLIMSKRYEKVKLSYFKTFVEYSFALMNENTGRHPNYLAKKYLFDRPFAYANYEYMDFFNQYFKQYLQKQAITKNGTLILDAINEQGDYRHLNELMKSDALLKNDTLRELVLIKGLYEMYYLPQYKKNKIRDMLEQVNGITVIKEHKKILFNILRGINNLQAGSPAPFFALRNVKGDTVRSSDFDKRFVYVSFFASWCTDCLEQFKKQEQLQAKYGDKIYFVSVAIDDDTAALKKFVKQNPKYKWIFLQGDKKTIMQYNGGSVPVYYLIGMQGQLLQSPALKPDEGIERKFIEILKIKPRKSR